MHRVRELLRRQPPHLGVWRGHERTRTPRLRRACPPPRELRPGRADRSRSDTSCRSSTRRSSRRRETYRTRAARPRLASARAGSSRIARRWRGATRRGPRRPPGPRLLRPR
jgi:hypothetical protein